ncbi:MAG: carbonic anhydrase, partial [Spirochaetia bacterium]|nr:carbonic anhydrase [Spirochaetia bacterium]
VIRIAGNVVDDTALGSIEYAVEHLGTRLIYVLGHEKCGAVKATVEAFQKGTSPNNHVLSIAKMILPSVKAVQLKKGDVLINAISENVRRVARELTASKPVLSEKIRKGKVQVRGGVYDLDTGKVNLVY